MKKEIGFIGLGKMGLNMATLLRSKDYRVLGTDKDQNALNEAREIGIETFGAYPDLIRALTEPRVVWLMVPAPFVDDALNGLLDLLGPGDTLIDGGNSFYQDSIRRYEMLKGFNINFLDCGTSGGVLGARDGSALMIGGEMDAYLEYEELFRDLATENGFARVGGPGAGHFVKMIHNGIEYGMMGAIAEGFATLHRSQDEFDIDLAKVFRPYENGSIISSKLLSFLHKAYTDGLLDRIQGEVPIGKTESEMEYITSISDSKILTAALEQRRATRSEPSYLGKLLSAMRHEFGGHEVIANEDHENNSE